MNKKQKILDKLFSLQAFGIKPGLEKTYQLLNKLNNPHNKLSLVHIAGTNGKGSVSSMIASILTEAGYKVGLYTSPHLEQFNERIRINGKMIEDDKLIELTEELLKLNQNIEATFFEVTTVMAFQHFAQSNIDIAIIETGLGGRLDATNVLNPILSVITSVGIDHETYLGDTIEDIAQEKAGIIKENISVVVSKNQSDVIESMKNKAESMNSDIYLSEDIELKNIRYNKNLTINFKYKDNKYFLPLAGSHQLENVKTVLKSLELLENQFPLKMNSIISGLKNIKHNTGLDSRIELIQSLPSIVLDVAHNLMSINRLIQTIGEHNLSDTKWNIMFAIANDKDADNIMKQLKPICNRLILCKPASNRMMNISVLNELADKIGFAKINSFENTKDALDYSTALKSPLLIIGSFYLIGEIKSLLY